MKKGIHPDYQLTKITCVCGNVIETRSTVKDIHVEICSACHPFYTGKQKLVDTAGRIDRFNKRYGIKDNKQFCKKTSKQGSLFYMLLRKKKPWPTGMMLSKAFFYSEHIKKNLS